MKKLALLLSLALVINLSVAPSVFAYGKEGKVTGKSIGAGALSLLVWPGIGQAVNEQDKGKVITHAVLGFTGIFRFWSCYDAVVDRDGGVWHDRI